MALGCSTPRQRIAPKREVAFLKAVQLLQNMGCELPDDFRVLTKRGENLWSFAFSYAPTVNGSFYVFVLDDGTTKFMPGY
jgi:hypothetical protein